jgi:prepilin-type N-terminal cleavage/methylation domain-containing protein
MKSSIRLRAFTLVELLVVIGIIAILISLLLPALGRVQQQALKTSCQAQTKDIGNALFNYAAENRGSLPYGHVWMFAAGNGNAAQLAAPAATSVGLGTTGPTFYRAFNWTSSVNAYMSKQSGGGSFPDGNKAASGASGVAFLEPNMIPLSKAFMCPTIAREDDFRAPLGPRNSYGHNMVAMPQRSFELNVGAPNNTNLENLTGSVGFTSISGTTLPIAPAKLGQLYPDTALFWDGPVIGAEDGFWIPNNMVGGKFWTAIDGGNLMYPRRPALRYRNANWTALFPEERGDLPIWVPTFQGEADFGFTLKWINADFPSGISVIPHFPNFARYRHMNNTEVSVYFADGSVRSLKVDRRKVAYTDSGGTDISVNEFTRNMLRLKPPPFQPGPTEAAYR